MSYYNPFMPTRHLHPRSYGLMVFGGGGGDPAPAPVAPLAAAPLAPAEPTVSYTSSKPELNNQFYDTLSQRNAAEIEVDKDNKAIANTGKGDQNKRQHAFWEKRYDIKITGEHFDASAKNERGAVVPLVYNIMGLPLDIEINKNAKKGTEYRYKYVGRGKSNHKIWYTGEKQDIYDFFTSNEWTSKNRAAGRGAGPYAKMEKALGVIPWRDSMSPAERKAIDDYQRADGFEWDDKKMDYVWVGLPKK